MSEEKDTRFKPGHEGFKKKGDSGIQKEIRGKIADFVKAKFELSVVNEIFDKASAKEKLRFITELLPYLTPKMKELTFEDITKPGATIDYSRLKPETLKEILGATTINTNDNGEQE